MNQAQIITLDGKEYKLEELSEKARIQVVNVQVVEAEITRLQQLLAIAQTARNTYVSSLIIEVGAGAEISSPKKQRQKQQKPK
ncbi:hypothetical protein KDX38_18420 [Pseudomonas sp. CDFA 602]|uniref:DUF6447 family protein n=1 Tax=Pseudomonas californiensis TaxID=2829823 RepID=UPI001E3242E1|nr:DUF6447 family protein [Pseudomonas californiensis]MCD5995589.1 hypothetical protein [Pseudomonas californiensis]MCD6001183.1 hypothetical protein [Pseudomonas californiensis]